MYETQHGIIIFHEDITYLDSGAATIYLSDYERGIRLKHTAFYAVELAYLEGQELIPISNEDIRYYVEY